MAARMTPGDKLREVVDIFHDVLREGFRPGHGAMSEAGNRAVAKGYISNPSMIHAWLARAARRGIEVDESNYRPDRYQQPVAKFTLTPAVAPTPAPDTGRRRRILFIPDAHNDPRHPHRLQVRTWIARYGSTIRFDDVVDSGDTCTFDSVSRHTKDDTLKARLKPGIRDDLDNHLEALKAFERGRDPVWKPRLKKCRGNHEQRLWSYEDQNPASAGTHTLAYEQHLLQFGWQERPYGEIFYIEGVGFTHHPMNVMGRALTGKTGLHRAGALATAPLVHGHTHRFGIYTDTKMGPVDKVMLVEGGCSLPDGEIEDYVNVAPTGWSYGVVDLTAEDGQITDIAFVSMRRLRREFSDDGADTRS